MIYKFLVDVKHQDTQAKFKIRDGIFELDEPKDGQVREWYDNMNKQQISILFSKDFVAFVSNDQRWLTAFQQGMRYCTNFPKEYDEALKNPDLAAGTDI